jgi:methylated-DNA-[protein]-cysteine S-methyltransferase
MSLYFKWIASPIGQLKLVASQIGLAAILWEGDRRQWPHLRGPLVEMPHHPFLLTAERELGEYFAGRRTAFSVRLDLHGTPFQEDVWRAMLTIPFGQVRSYGELARQIGRPSAVRAVGAAAGMNPVAIMAPCHRVLGSTGRLTGFAGGLEAKKGLLAVEGIFYRQDRDPTPGSPVAARPATRKITPDRSVAR